MLSREQLLGGLQVCVRPANVCCTRSFAAPSVYSVLLSGLPQRIIVLFSTAVYNLSLIRSRRYSIETRAKFVKWAHTAGPDD